MPRCPALSRTLSMSPTLKGSPSFWKEATSALAVPDVSTCSTPSELASSHHAL